MKEKMMSWCEERAQVQLELLKELAAIPAPSHREEKRVEWLCDWLKQLGAEDVRVDGALNVIVTLEASGAEAAQSGKGPYHVFMAHTDVVFPDMTELPVREENGRLYAPGVGDDTANVVGLMLCLEYLLKEKAEIKKPMLIVFNSCEEGLGNLKGVRRIAQDYDGRIEQLISFDGTYDGIVYRAVGSERWNVTAKTIGGHSYGAFGNPNAIAALADLIVRLYAQPVPDGPDQKTTFNVGTIGGGTSVNTIAQNAEMLYEYRSDDRDCLAQMRTQFDDTMAAVVAEWGGKAQFAREIVGQRPCGGDIDAAKQEALLERCSAIIEEFSGVKPARRPSSTDANIPLALGIPATCFGMYRGAGAHTREEYLEIGSLVTGLKIGLTIITDFCC